jgi:proteasome lid subunit RPN8/RPN11
MSDADQETYAAIITVSLPGMLQPATVTVTLQAPDAIPTSSGETKPLQDCTLADLMAFAQALEQQIMTEYGQVTLADLVATEAEQIKITILNEAGEPLAMTREEVLSHGLDLATAEPVTHTEVGPDELVSKTTETQNPAEDDHASAPVDEDDVAAQELATGEDELAATAVADEPAEAERSDTPTAREEETAPGEAAVGAAEEEAEVAEAEVAQEEVTAAEASAVPGEAAAEEAEAAPPATTESAAVATAEAPAPPVEAPELRILGLRRPPGHATPAAADILINESAFREAQAHARSDLSREVAGMLVGPRPEKQPDGRYVVHVTDIIIARHTRMQGASVTYTPESWRYVTDVLHERYPEEEAVIVGWYHTHPGFGIFLSGMDLFIHQHFFTQKWHVALVLDPLAQRSGFFCWDRQQKEVQKYPFPWPDWAQSSW